MRIHGRTEGHTHINADTNVKRPPPKKCNVICIPHSSYEGNIFNFFIFQRINGIVSIIPRTVNLYSRTHTPTI